jgi:hypothetical protein
LQVHWIIYSFIRSSTDDVHWELLKGDGRRDGWREEGRGLDEKEADEEGGGSFPLRIRRGVRQVGSGASQPCDSAFYSIIGYT